MNWKSAAKLILAVALGGVPLITTASCDPYRGSLDIFRDDDHDGIDVIIDDWYYDDCYYWDDCYYYDEVVIWD